MANLTMAKNYIAANTINPYRIVKFGSNDGEVVSAAASADSMIGVSGELGVLAGERCDIIKIGIARIEFGGTVTRGAPVTSAANGVAVVAAPAAGTNVRIIGFAEVSAVAGDIADVLLSPGVMQG